MRKFISAAIVILACASDGSSAATIAEGSGDCQITLSGPINLGDADRLAALMETAHGTACLNSQGGSYLEGVKIALLFRANSIPTMVLRGQSCLSACAIAFMGGSLREDDSVNPVRTLSAGGRLGFHAPYLAIPGGVYNEGIVQKAYNDALLAVAELAVVMNDLDFSPQLLGAMLKSDRNSFFEIDDVHKAVVERIYVVDHKEPPARNAETVRNACDNLYSRVYQISQPFSVLGYSGGEYTTQGSADGVIHKVAGYPPEAGTECIDNGSWAELRSGEQVLSGKPVFFSSFYYFKGSTKLVDILE